MFDQWIKPMKLKPRYVAQVGALNDNRSISSASEVASMDSGGRIVKSCRVGIGSCRPKNSDGKRAQG